MIALSNVVRLALVVFGAANLAGCDIILEREATESVRDALRDPESARFSEMEVVEYEPGSRAVCGEVNAKNAYGGYTGDKRFYYRAGGLAVIEPDPLTMSFGDGYSASCFTPSVRESVAASISKARARANN